eukprot:scaffold772_cov361-Prasinococcus_capsulatus_cf.AAC.8
MWPRATRAARMARPSAQLRIILAAVLGLCLRSAAYPVYYSSCFQPTTNPMTGGSIAAGTATWTLRHEETLQVVTEYIPDEE